MNGSVMNVVCYERSLLWTGLLWMGLLWTWSVMNVVCYEWSVLNGSVLNGHRPSKPTVTTGLSMRGSTSLLIELAFFILFRQNFELLTKINCWHANESGNSFLSEISVFTCDEKW